MAETKKDSLGKVVVSKVIDGGLAGVCGVSATFPMDLAKTRLQAQVTVAGQTPKYKNLFHTMKVVAQKEGAAALYSGYSVNVGFIVFEKAIKLVANDMFRLWLADENGHVGLQSSILAGASAGAAQTIVTTPMELLKIKGQEAGSRGERFNAIKAMKDIAGGPEGIRGFYRGWCSTLIRDVPFSFLYFPMYAELHNSESFGSGESFKGNLAAGMISGAIAGGLSTPTDVIKTRLQNQNPNEPKMSWQQCFSNVKGEGVKAFYKGAGPRMICIGSLFAVAQGFYELGTGKKVCEKAGW